MTTRMAATILMMAGGLLLASPIAAAQNKETGVAATTTKPAFTNHLAKATSPYLLQHQHNPVDWYEWGPEALDLARREDKPIFLSIGYAACHWCHVMAHESFESPEIAAIMNRNFVNIKVDREERPDLDDLYMQATQIVNRGQGGWPMSVWLTPELKPFYAGTYFPPAARWGRPGFGEICERFGEAWRTQRAELIASADQLANLVRDQLAPSAGDGAIVDLGLVDKTADFLTRAFDAQRGGMSGGGTNKFPPSMALDVMLRAAHRKPADDPQRRQLIALVELTLDEMARGGIFDQLAGGIHRYSTDVEWLVPHFEKMLYDQALVSRSYLDAYQLTGNPEYAAVARRIFDYVLADLQSPEGGFYSTRDADSEGEEGKYYVWTREEVVAAVGPQDADLFCRFYDITERGNWDDPHFPGVPKNIPRIKTPLAKFAIENKLEPTEVERRLAAGREKLLGVRAKRIAPGLDDKILCEWNGMMIASLARGGAVLDEPRYLEAARRAADFVLTRQWRDGRLLRSWRAGRTLSAAFLTDYACLIEGLLDLYEATLEPRWFAAALELNAVVIREYWDESAGAFFFTAHDHEQLLTRNKDLGDGATPSGNSVQLMNLLRLSAMLGDVKLRTLAERTMRCFAGDLAAAPWSAERFLCGVDFAFVGPTEIALIGPPAAPVMRDLRRVIGQAYLPNKVVVGHDPADPTRLDQSRARKEAVAGDVDASRIDLSRARKEAVAGDVDPATLTPSVLLRSPLLADRPMIGNQPTAYVCRNYACQKPVTKSDDLKAQLSPASAQLPP